MNSKIEATPLAASHPDHPVLTREQLLAHVDKIIQAIEQCGASPELTAAVSLASDLSFHLRRRLEPCSVKFPSNQEVSALVWEVHLKMQSIPGISVFNAAEISAATLMEKIKELNP